MPPTFTQWFSAFRKYWIASFLTFVAIMAIAVMAILYGPRLYRSEAKLMLRIGRESLSIDPTAGNSTRSVHQTRGDEIQSSLGVMKSREILEKVIDEIGVGVILDGVLSDGGQPRRDDEGILSTLKGKLGSIDPVSSREMATQHLASAISVYAPTDSSVVSISYRTKSPEVAQSVVQCWINSYIAEHARVSRTQGTYDFFRKQGEELEKLLNDARLELQNTKSKYELVTVPGAQLMLEGQMTSVRQGLLEVETEIAASESRIKAFADILANSIDSTITEETSGKANEARDQMRSQLFALEVLEKDLRSKLTGDHPKLLAIQRQVEASRKILNEQEGDRKEVTRSVNPAYQQLSEYQLVDLANREGLDDKRQTLVAKKQELLAEMTALNEHERSIAALTKNMQILEDRYTSHAEKLEQARMDQVLEDAKITSVSVVQRASLEERPVTPNKPMCAVVGFLAACAASFSLPILLEMRAAGRLTRRRATESHDWKYERARTDRPTIEDSVGKEMTSTSVLD
jgi:polysaccharide biosynthesis protein PslE